MLKKILLFSALFFILAIGIASYIIFVKKPTSSTLTATNTSSNNLPFGAPSSNQPIQTSVQGTGTVDAAGNKIVTVSKLMEVSADPVAGATSITIGTTTIVRYTEKGSAHITDVNLSMGTSSKVSNTTIPLVYDAFWFNNGSTFAVRYPDTSNTGIISYSETLVAGTSSIKNVVSTQLPDNIESLAVSPDSKKIFFLTDTPKGEQGIIANPNGTKATTLFNSSFGEWLATWPTNTTIALTTKASSGNDGYLYFIDTKTQLMRKVIGNIPGLTTLVNPAATLVAYSDNSNILHIYDTTTTRQTSSVTTLAEKCVWSKKQTSIIYCAVPSTISPGLYPDSWYQGLVSFIDSIYKIDTFTGKQELVGDLQSQFKQNIDAIHPILSSDENYLIFTNKKDYTLWSLKLTP